MTITIKPSFAGSFDYRGTFFGDLAVTVYEPKPDEFGKMIDDAFGTTTSATAIRFPPMVYKTYWPTDRRYNPIKRDWTLDDLIAKLDIVASFGPVAEKSVERHTSFTIERERPEDKYLKVNAFGVCLNEWGFEPIYYVGQFEALTPAISAMREIQAYLRDQESL